MYLILTNPDGEEAVFNAKFRQPEGSKLHVEIRQVDEKLNNAVMNPPCMELQVTEKKDAEIIDGEANVSLTLPRFGFASMTVTVE